MNGWRRIPELDGATLLAEVRGLGIVAVDAADGDWRLDPDNPSRFRS